MPDPLTIRQELERTEAMLGRFERRAAAHPGAEFLQAALDALEDRWQELEDELARVPSDDARPTEREAAERGTSWRRESCAGGSS